MPGQYLTFDDLTTVVVLARCIQVSFALSCMLRSPERRILFGESKVRLPRDLSPISLDVRFPPMADIQRVRILQTIA